MARARQAQHAHPQARQKRDFGEPLPHHRMRRADHSFDDAQVGRLGIARGRHSSAHTDQPGAKIGRFGERGDLVGAGAHDQVIFCCQHKVIKLAALHHRSAFDCQHPDTRPPADIGVAQPFADIATLLGQDQVGEIDIAFAFQILCARTAIGQQDRAEQEQGRKTGHECHQANRGDLENSERGLSGLFRNPIDQQVRRGADQRQRATKDGDV